MQALDLVTRLDEMFPELKKTTTALRSLVRTTRGFDYPEFEEPKTLLVFESGEDAEVTLDVDLIAAWVGHMSHSSRVRMELLEDGVLRSLANSEVITSATLARAHIEAAAWAAFAYEELLKVGETASWSRLTRLLPKMLYGTAVAREAKRLPPDERDPFWVEVTSVMNAVDALDRFFAVTTGLTEAPLRVLYAVLSDYAHPAIRGVRHLFDTVTAGDAGWTIAYTWSERAKPAEADLILKSLLTSMRFGHGAALLMRLGIIEETEADIKYLKPDPSLEMDVKWHVIFGETSGDDA